MAKSKIQYANADVMVINTNGANHVKDTFATVMKMVNEFGVCKTHMAIQSLFDTDRIDQNTAGFMIDALKKFVKPSKASLITLM